jgi:hypothetical protein
MLWGLVEDDRRGSFGVVLGCLRRRLELFRDDAGVVLVVSDERGGVDRTVVVCFVLETADSSLGRLEAVPVFLRRRLELFRDDTFVGVLSLTAVEGKVLMSRMAETSQKRP